MKRTLCVLPALALSFGAVLTGCGVDTSADAGPSAGSASAEAVTYEGADPEGLVACLGDAGVPSRVTDAVPFGVEVPVVDVDADGGATLWVFRTVAEAEENRSLITITDEDTPLSRLVGNVVVQYADLDEALAGVVDGCLA